MKSQSVVEHQVSTPSKAQSDPQLQGVNLEPLQRTRIAEAELERFQQLLKHEDFATMEGESALSPFKLLDSRTPQLLPMAGQRHAGANAAHSDADTPMLNAQTKVTAAVDLDHEFQLPTSATPLHRAIAEQLQHPLTPHQHAAAQPALLATNGPETQQPPTMPVTPARPEQRASTTATAASHPANNLGSVTSVSDHAPLLAEPSGQPSSAAAVSGKVDQLLTRTPTLATMPKHEGSKTADGIAPNPLPSTAPGRRADSPASTVPAASAVAQPLQSIPSEAPDASNRSSLITRMDWLKLQDSPELASLLSRLVEATWSPAPAAVAPSTGQIAAQLPPQPGISAGDGLTESSAPIAAQLPPQPGISAGNGLTVSSAPIARAAEATPQTLNHQLSTGAGMPSAATLTEPNQGRPTGGPADARAAIQDSLAKPLASPTEPAPAPAPAEEPIPLEVARASTQSSVVVEPAADIRMLNREVTDLVNRLVDKMWVKGADTTLPPEVRLNLKSDVLPETQLRIVRTDNNLTVQFTTMSAASYQTLALGRPDLVSILQRRYGVDQVSVKVSLAGDKRSDEEESVLEASPFNPPTNDQSADHGA